MSGKTLVIISIATALLLCSCSKMPQEEVISSQAESSSRAISTDESSSVNETGSSQSSLFEPVNPSDSQMDANSDSSEPQQDDPGRSEPALQGGKTTTGSSAEAQKAKDPDSSAGPSAPTAAPSTVTQPASVFSSVPESKQDPAPASTTAAESTPAASSESTSKPTPTFNISQYVTFAQNYGTSIGLKLNSSATGCWDTPTGANAGCIYLERDLKGLLDWYKASGFTDFWVWSEDLGNGNYNIFIGYA